MSFFFLDSLVERSLVFELRRFFRFRRPAFLSFFPKNFLSIPCVSRSVLFVDFLTVVCTVLGPFLHNFFPVVLVVLFRFFSNNFSICGSVFCLFLFSVVENFFLFCGHFFIFENFGKPKARRPEGPKDRIVEESKTR